MVCVPCFVIPVLLFVWHRFIQPLMLRYWNPWAVKDANGQVLENKVPDFPFQCAGGVCPFPGASKKVDGGGGAAAAADDEAPSTLAAGDKNDTIQVGDDDDDDAAKKIN